MSPPEPDDKAQLLTRKRAYPGRVIQLDLERVMLPNGHVTELEIFHHPGASCVVPFVTEEEIVLIRQYRHAVGGYVIEAPAGKLDGDEDPLLCAHRELKEETGYTAGRMDRLGTIVTTPGFCDERIHLYAARDLTPGDEAHEDAEVLTKLQVGRDEAWAMVLDGRIEDAKTIAALGLALHRG